MRESIVDISYAVKLATTVGCPNTMVSCLYATHHYASHRIYELVIGIRVKSHDTGYNPRSISKPTKAASAGKVRPKLQCLLSRNETPWNLCRHAGYRKPNLLFRGVWHVADLLPHLHRLDRHFGRLGLPGRVPLILSAQEILGRRLRLVHPRLTGRAILEPPIGTSNGQVDDEIEFLIEWRVQVGVIDPRVGEGGAVGVGQRELSTGPEIFIERVVEDLQETGVDVSEEVFLTPLQAIRVCAGGVGGMKRCLLFTGAPIAVILLVRPPMECARDDIISAGRVGVVVASRLGNVDFARGRPSPESVVDGQQPNRGPEPVAHRHRGNDFDSAIFEGCTFEGVDAAGFDGGNYGAVGDVCGGVAVVV